MADDFTAYKLAQLDAALIDPAVSSGDFCVLYYLHSATDRQTGIAKRKQTTIGAALGIKRRTVQMAIERLSPRYFETLTKEGGSYINGYLMQPKIAQKNAQSDLEIAQNETKIAQFDAPNCADSFAPILPFKSLDLPSRARDAASVKSLAALGSALARVIGNDAYASWFRGASIADVSEDTITIEAPTSFRRARIASDYEMQILDCCKSLGVGIKRVVVTKAKVAA